MQNKILSVTCQYHRFYALCVLQLVFHPLCHFELIPYLKINKLFQRYTVNQHTHCCMVDTDIPFMFLVLLNFFLTQIKKVYYKKCVFNKNTMQPKRFCNNTTTNNNNIYLVYGEIKHYSLKCKTSFYLLQSHTKKNCCTTNISLIDSHYNTSYFKQSQLDI